jgi:hypothetical protein
MGASNEPLVLGARRAHADVAAAFFRPFVSRGPLRFLTCGKRLQRL